MLRKVPCSLVAVSLILSTLIIAGQVAADPDKVSAFAKVRANGSLATFGGHQTRSAESANLLPGVYRVTFTGSYPKAIIPDDIVLNTTAESLIFGVSNAIVESATAAEIRVRVFTWPSNTAILTNNTFFVTLFIGE